MEVHPRKLLERLANFLDEFSPAFGRSGRTDSARRYVKGLLSDAKRKNMACMSGRVADPGDYQALQHFISHSTWSSDRVWSMLREKVGDRAGVLIVDDTGIPKRGKHSVGVARQYSGTLGKTGNCQIVVSTVLRSEQATWPMGMGLYLPEEWATKESLRGSAAIPDNVKFQRKWEIALQQIDDANASEIDIQCVVADAGYGYINEFREGLAQRGLRYVLAVQKSLSVFDKPPRFARTRSGERSKATLASNSPKAKPVDEIASAMAPEMWECVRWRNGSKNKPLEAEFAAIRVVPARGVRSDHPRSECWLLCERPKGEIGPVKFHLSNLPEEVALEELVRIAHTRWAIEQSYEQLKDELALDHFEGRSYPGFHHHLVLTALAYAFLGLERQRSKRQKPPTLNHIRWLITEIVTAQLFAAKERLSQMVTDFIRDPPDV